MKTMTNAFRNVTLILVVLIFSGCASKNAASKAIDQSRVSIKNFGKEFDEFMFKSKDAKERDAFGVWSDVVESKDPSFYSQVIGNSLFNADWRSGYEQSFARTLPYFKKYEFQIKDEFSHFDQRVIAAIGAFSSIFPDFNLSQVPIYGVPSLMIFNGQSAEVDKKPVLVFGIDMIVILKNESGLIPGAQFKSNSDVLYAHEIFHIYHNKKQGFSEEKVLQSGRLIHAAWNEGLATYASSLVNPNATNGELLMDDALAKECSLKQGELIKKFARIANMEFGKPEGRSIYKDWFLLSSKDKNIPIRAGYCVGLTLARMVAQKFSISEMVSWRFEEVPDKLSSFLPR